MRDLDRIEPVLEAVRRAWEHHPDLRLGQLLYSAVGQGRDDVPPCPPLFYIEDDAVIAALESLEGTAAE